MVHVADLILENQPRMPGLLFAILAIASRQKCLENALWKFLTSTLMQMKRCCSLGLLSSKGRPKNIR